MLYIMLCIQITFLKNKVRVVGLDYLSLFSGWISPVVGLLVSLFLYVWACLLSMSANDRKLGKD